MLDTALSSTGTAQRQLGQMRIDGRKRISSSVRLCQGRRSRASSPLFHEFETAVEVQALHVIETLDAAIAALGLHLQWPDAREPIAVQDVQIWSDGSITCRLREQSVASAKTAPQTKSLRQTAEATNRRT